MLFYPLNVNGLCANQHIKDLKKDFFSYINSSFDNKSFDSYKLIDLLLRIKDAFCLHYQKEGLKFYSFFLQYLVSSISNKFFKETSLHNIESIMIGIITNPYFFYEGEVWVDPHANATSLINISRTFFVEATRVYLEKMDSFFKGKDFFSVITHFSNYNTSFPIILVRKACESLFKDLLEIVSKKCGEKGVRELIHQKGNNGFSVLSTALVKRNKEIDTSKRQNYEKILSYIKPYQSSKNTHERNDINYVIGGKKISVPSYSEPQALKRKSAFLEEQEDSLFSGHANLKQMRSTNTASINNFQEHSLFNASSPYNTTIPASRNIAHPAYSFSSSPLPVRTEPVYYSHPVQSHEDASSRYFGNVNHNLQPELPLKPSYSYEFCLPTTTPEKNHLPYNVTVPHTVPAYPQASLPVAPQNSSYLSHPPLYPVRQNPIMESVKPESSPKKLSHMQLPSISFFQPVVERNHLKTIFEIFSRNNAKLNLAEKPFETDPLYIKNIVSSTSDALRKYKLPKNDILSLLKVFSLIENFSKEVAFNAYFQGIVISAIENIALDFEKHEIDLLEDVLDNLQFNENIVFHTINQMRLKSKNTILPSSNWQKKFHPFL